MIFSRKEVLIHRFNHFVMVLFQGVKLASSVEDLTEKLGTKIMVRHNLSVKTTC